MKRCSRYCPLYLPQKTGRNERTGDCRAAEQRERAGSQRVQTAVRPELSQWVQSWHSCKVASDSGAEDSWKSGLYLRFAEERSEVYCNHAVCCGASHVL